MTDREAFETWSKTQGAPGIPVNAYDWKLWQAATLAERERCVAICDKWSKANHVYVNGAIRCSEDIRKGEQP